MSRAGTKLAIAVADGSGSRHRCLPFSGRQRPGQPSSTMARAKSISRWHAERPRATGMLDRPGPHRRPAVGARSPRPSSREKFDAGPSAAVDSSDSKHGHVRFHDVDGCSAR